jgi:hypothetical protein
MGKTFLSITVLRYVTRTRTGMTTILTGMTNGECELAGAGDDSASPHVGRYLFGGNLEMSIQQVKCMILL